MESLSCSFIILSWRWSLHGMGPRTTGKMNEIRFGMGETESNWNKRAKREREMELYRERARNMKKVGERGAR